jgi:LmbE family N-acetylglucosaminyl deacetylase
LGCGNTYDAPGIVFLLTDEQKERIDNGETSWISIVERITFIDGLGDFQEQYFARSYQVHGSVAPRLASLGPVSATIASCRCTRRFIRKSSRDRRLAGGGILDGAMAKTLRRLTLAAGLASLVWLVPRAQMRVVPVDEEQGHVALGLAIRHLTNTGIFMTATAHPDDENNVLLVNNGLLVELNRGQGYRTALATATRGNGGQSEIGPEVFEPLGVLRTQELAALHRFDGAEQYFTRAVDFGYTIDLDETLKQGGGDEIIGDYVRLIRTIRPDVISAQSPTAGGPGQHAHHALAAILSHEAYKVAGDPTKYPEQIRQGRRQREAPVVLRLVC